MPLVKSILHNIGVVIAGLAIALIGTRLELIFRLGDFRSVPAIVAGSLLLITRILLRVHLPFVELFIRREERQLARDFGAKWLAHRGRVRRWV